MSKSEEMAHAEMPPYVPRTERLARGPERIVLCRCCGRDTGIVGAAYCDPCRPGRVSDTLMTPVDWARTNEGAP